jgi:lysophospholipase L1-like esterase
VLLQPHSGSYRNRAVRLAVSRPWRFCFIPFRCRDDGHYGLGGVSAESRGGSTTTFTTREDGEYGRTASRVELWYVATPGGGSFELAIDEQPPVVVSTAADRQEDRWHALEVEPGPHRVVVHAVGDGPVRGYGVVLETDGPGVVWDTLSMIGAFTPRLLEHDDASFRAQLEQRASDLVILGYGGNDLRRFIGGAVSIEAFEEETRQLLARVRDARPDGSCLVTGIIEHTMSGSIRVRSEHVEAIVDAQRRAATAVGCAFFDVFRAMGGAGSYRRWRAAGMAADDGKHLNQRGRDQVADWIYEALVAAYVEHRTMPAARPAR